MIMAVGISVIVPVYNTEKSMLDRCIDSILNQTVAPLEIIIVDDGSQEETAAYCDQIADKYDLIKTFHKENGGCGPARDFGVERASGEYVVYFDSDDLIAKYAVEEISNAIRDNDKPDLVIGLIKKYLTGDESLLCREANEKVSYIPIESPEERVKLINHMLGVPWDRLDFAEGHLSDVSVAKIVKREIASKVIFQKDDIWNEDTLWSLKLVKACDSIIVFDDLIYAYIFSIVSMTKRFRPDCLGEFLSRTELETDTIVENWPECMAGLDVLLWRDTAALGRTYLYHEDNPQGFMRRYADFLKAVKAPKYRAMLKRINFGWETSAKKRISKEMLRFMMLYGPKIMAFILWKKICDLNNKIVF